MMRAPVAASATHAATGLTEYTSSNVASTAPLNAIPGIGSSVWGTTTEGKRRTGRPQAIGSFRNCNLDCELDARRSPGPGWAAGGARPIPGRAAV